MAELQMVKKRDKLIAIIIKNNYENEGVSFITPSEYSQQLAYMHHTEGKIIDAHVHNLVHRNVLEFPQNVIIKRIQFCKAPISRFLKGIEWQFYDIEVL